MLSMVVLGVGTIGIQASPTCQRIIQKYVEKAVPHHFSTDTLARWAKWNKEHPNYHPPKRKPTYSPQETLEKVNFDCRVDTDPVDVALLLPPELPPTLDLNPRMVNLVTTDTVPPPVPPTVSLVNAPADVPAVPVVETSEPAAFLYLLTGAVFLLICGKKAASRFPMVPMRDPLAE